MDDYIVNPENYKKFSCALSCMSAIAESSFGEIEAVREGTSAIVKVSANTLDLYSKELVEFRSVLTLIDALDIIAPDPETVFMTMTVHNVYTPIDAGAVYE